MLIKFLLLIWFILFSNVDNNVEGDGGDTTSLPKGDGGVGMVSGGYTSRRRGVGGVRVVMA